MGKSITRGVLVFRRNGKAHVEVGQRRKFLQLTRSGTGTGLHGNEVEIRPLARKKGDRRKQRKPSRPRHEVVKVLNRSLDQFLGYAKKEGVRWIIRPEDGRIHVNFSVSGNLPRKLKEGNKVLVQFTKWDQPRRTPLCRVLRVLGPAGDSITDHLGILAKYKLPSHFPKQAVKELDAIPDKVPATEIKGRLDLRERFTLTVDPIDARDFDDALSVHLLKDGNVEVGVHIADVSAYVRAGTALDNEAYRRGNSTYLVGEVIPMLPKQLSNGICSLVEGEDRLTKSVLYTFDGKGKILGRQLAETIICSDKRLTYEQAKLLMDEQDLSKVRSAKPPESRYSGAPGSPLEKVPEKKLLQLQSSLRKLWKLAESLRRGRLSRGALDLGGEEVKILVDDRGRPERMMRMVNDESHQLIEEFMLLANETVAKEFKRLKRPALHRVHDEPDPEKLDELRSFASMFGISCGDLNHRKAMTKLGKSIKGHPLSQVLRIKLLRSLRKACYRSSPDGHYGLAKKDYLHFTSPIRRYADLIVHRILESHLRNSRKTSHSYGRLDGIAKHISETERNSIDAERESKKTKLVAYYAREIEENNLREHKATITQIGRKGFFVELDESLAQGFVALRTLPRHEGYRVSTNETAITARNSKNTLNIGQTIKVVIDRIDRDEKLLDFRLA